MTYAHPGYRVVFLSHRNWFRSDWTDLEQEAEALADFFKDLPGVSEVHVERKETTRLATDDQEDT